MVTPPAHALPNNKVYYLGADSILAFNLGSILNQQGLRLATFAAPESLAAATATALPKVLILDLEQVPIGSTLRQFLDDLMPGAGQRPGLLCIAAQGAIEPHLRAIRAGAQGIYTAPVPVRDLADKVISISGVNGASRYRVLVVEDDPVQAKYIAALLTNAGMEPREVGEPLRVLDVIRAFRPDLVLMDLYMPDANGDELTAIIRAQDEFFDLPIIFLSSEQNQDRQMDALRVGADSFIVKPVQRKLLVDSIDHRIRMSRWLRERRQAASRRGSASGLLQTDQFLRQLDRHVRNGGVPQDGCGLLLIDLDSPQATLERLCFNGTERLLRGLEAEISNRMNTEESATRLGDFSYAVLAKREDAQALADLAERLRGLVSEAGSWPADEAATGITVSVGVGLFVPPADDALTMISRGQKAAMVARLVGGTASGSGPR